MRLLWLSFAVIILVAVVAGQDCQDDEGNQYQEGQNWLRDDCNKRFKCKNGKIKTKSYNCPSNSHCTNNGECTCDFGYAPKSVDGDGILKKCKEEKKHKCGKGFRRKYGKCLAIDKYGNLNYHDALTKCREKGGRLLIADDLFGLFKKFKKDHKLKFMIGGAPELSSKELQDIKKEKTRQFVLRMMDRTNCRESDRYKAFKKFSPRATPADLNAVTPLSSKCLAFDCRDEKAPTIVNCNSRMGYICEEVGGDVPEEDSSWSKWFNIQKNHAKGDRESLKKVLKSLNKDKDNTIRLCKRPLATECREVGTDKLYTKEDTHGLKLSKACEDNMIRCRHKRNNDACPDFEIRFKCPIDDGNDCSVRDVRKTCENRGKRCVNRADGAKCVRKKRQKNKKEKVNIQSCVYNGQTISMHQCKASGDPHYTSLDQKKFDFQGTCSYDFISTCNSYIGTDDYPSFSIVVKNYKTDETKDVSWTKHFQLLLGQNKYIFADGELYVDSGSVRKEKQLGYSDDMISITGCQKGKTVKILIETKFCLKITWDNRHSLSVFVPDIYKNHVCGLCGNFDGDPENDHRNAETNQMMTMQQIGREYLVKGPDGEICNSVVPEPTPCSEENWNKFKAPGFCGVFDVDSNSPLAQAVIAGCDPSVLEDNKNALRNELKECITDLCWDVTTNRCHDLEDVIEDMMNALVLDKDALDDAWREFANCKDTEETRCADKPNMEYSRAFVPSCQNTCQDMEKAEDCEDLETVSGCVCQKDFYLDADFNCVPYEQCEKSCSLNMEDGRVVVMNDGEDYVLQPCEQIAMCKDGEVTEESLAPCSDHAECAKFGKICECRKGFTGNGNECKTDLTCRKGYHAYGSKCYKFVRRSLRWHDAAINCGADGASLARYDVPADDELRNFFRELPSITSRANARRKTINCRQGGKCRLPKNHIGVSIKLKNKKRDKDKCAGKFSLSDDGASIDIEGDCQARFVVRMINVKKTKQVTDFRTWIGGNLDVISQKKRIKYSPYQIDPPRMLDMAPFNGQGGCFQARLNKNDVLVITPNPKCTRKRASICEYDNPGKPVYDPNDFKGIKQKATHEEAILLCAEKNRPLASINDKKQLRKVQKILSKFGGDGWLSGKYNPEKDNFMWSDNTIVKLKNWRKKEPNNYKGDKNDELCVSMDKNKGYWFSDNCDDRLFPVCGPPLDIEPVAYSPYYRVKNFRTLDELRQILVREGRDEYVCEKPLAMECIARDKNTGEWVSNQDQQGETITCTPTLIRCRSGQGLRCNSLKARFLCPTDENQCRSLKDIQVTPCDGGRICLPVKNHYICRCPNGKKFNEHTQSCSAPCGVCHTWGDPHYTTFSGERYDFMGTCMYKYSGMCDLGDFERDPNFDVYTKNEPCGRSGRVVSCIYYIEVHLRNMPVKLPDGGTKKRNFVFKLARGTCQYTMNNQEMTQVDLEEPGVYIVHRRQNFFELFSEVLELSVLFSGAQLTVKVPNKYRNHMCGLCGDCGTEGFKMRNGTVVTVPEGKKSKLDRELIIPVANDWIVPYPGADQESCKAVEPLKECTAEQEAEFSQPDKCGIFKDASSSISSCFSTLDPDEYYESCLEDSCNSDPVVSVCNTVKTYAQACAAKNKVLDWRKENFCYMDCGEKEYRAVASCQPTCGRSLVSAANCAEEPEEGCVCPDGTMRRGDECVRPEDCGCEIIFREGENPWLLPPGDSVLLPGCLEMAICEVQEDGSVQEVIESFSLDPNAICVEGPPPVIECAKGFIMEEGTCKKDPDGCGPGYQDKEGLCVKIPPGKRIWRRAVEACNQESGTLVLVDTDVKLNELGEIMEEKEFDQLFISGQVKALVGPSNDVTFKAVLSASQRGKVEYENFDYHEPPVSVILLSEELTFEDLIGNNTVLALVARREEDGVNIYAVPRDSAANFICEERDVPEEDTKWYDPCNSDDIMEDNGDIETRKALLKNPDCEVCPKPMDVRCSDVEGATGQVKGECGITRSDTYYSCEQGEDCIDQAVSTKCAKDVDECEENLHDCPDRSECENTVGAYRCKCIAEFPLMVNNQCQGVKTCRMVGPGNNQDYLYSVRGFSNRRGYFDYDCSFQIAGVCNYERAMAIPLLTFSTMSEQTEVGYKHKIAGAVYDHVTNQHRTWSVTAESLEQGKIMFGTKNETRSTLLGFTCGPVRARFTFSAPNTLVIRHLDNYFRATISFPFQIKVKYSEAYENNLCGVCALEPPAPNEKIELTLQQALAVSVQNLSPCSLPPEMPTTPQIAQDTTTPKAPVETTVEPPLAVEPTTAAVVPEEESLPPTIEPPPQPTTLPPPPAPTTQPPPPPPTTQPPPQTTMLMPTTTPEIIVDDFCSDVIQMCSELESLCDTSMGECLSAVCYGEQEVCNYLMSMDFENCRTGSAMENFLNAHPYCDELCGPDMQFDFAFGFVQPTCLDPYAEGAYDEGSSYDGIFTCTCSEAYILSGGVCILKDDCGCVTEDDGYVEKNFAWNDDNCTKKYTCDGGNDIIEEPMQCSENSKCVLSDEGYVCECEDGFYGSPEMEGGCTRGDEDDPSKICFDDLTGDIVERRCICRMGYVSDCSDCIDFDECKEGVHDCHPSKEKCVNDPGTYHCECADGFRSQDGDCIDIDECVENGVVCGDNQACVNTPGRYRCECCAGFTMEAEACVRDFGVAIITDNPRCCINCDDPVLCNEIERVPWCLRTFEGDALMFPTYRALFQYACVNNIRAPRNMRFRDRCPELIAPTTKASNAGQATTAAGNPLTEGQNPENTGPSAGEATLENPSATNSAPDTKPTTQPPETCSSPNFCSKIIPPPDNLKNGPVCGPDSSSNPKTYDNYCEMVRDICYSVGSPDSLPPESIKAAKGPCPTPTTTTPTTPPTPPTKEIEATDSVGLNTEAQPEATAGPGEPITASLTTQEPLDDPLFSSWSKFTNCLPVTQGKNCGPGLQSRSRSVVPYDDERPVRPPEDNDIYEIRTCFAPCDPADPNFNPDDCGGDGICGTYEPVCGEIGTDGRKTFDNECELNVKACQESKVPTLVNQGPCGPDDDPSTQRMCETAGPIEVRIGFEEKEDGIVCAGEPLTLMTCAELLCEGESDTCCRAVDFERKIRYVDCFDDETAEFVGSARHVYLSALACKCETKETQGNGPVLR